MRGPIRKFHGHVVTSVIAVAIGLSILGVLILGSGGLPSFDDPYGVRVVTPSSAAIAPQSRVTMAGVTVGKVVSVQRHGQGAVVEIEIDDDHQPIPADTRATIRMRTLVGEKFMELSAGISERHLPDGGLIAIRPEDDFVEVDQILSQLSGRTRDRARAAVRSLADALGDRAPELNRLIAGTTGVISEGTPVVTALARQRRELQRLVSNLGVVAADVGERDQAVDLLARDIATVTRTVAGRDDALRALLEELPPMLDQTRSASAVLRTTANRTTPVVSRLAGTMERLDGVVDDLGPATAIARDVVTELGATAPGLNRALVELDRLAPLATETLPAVRGVLCEANPLLRYVAPYHREIGALFPSLGSAINAYDATGHNARLDIGVGSHSLYGTMPTNVAKALDDVTSSGLLRRIHLLGYNPYPRPGEVNQTRDGRDSIGPADAFNQYQRVQADC